MSRVWIALALAVSSAALCADGVRPGDDFYRYANGAWLAANTIPAGKPSFDSSSPLRDENARRVRALIEGAAGGKVNGALERKIGDYYASWIDAGGIESKGLAPLSVDLAAIAGIKDRTTLSAYLGSTLHLDDGSNTQTDSLFGVWIHQGFHDPDHYVPHVVQGGLGLADREDYLDPGKADERKIYQAHIAAVLKLAGFADADARAARIFDLEMAIAKTHASRADTDDIFKTDNPWKRADFDAKAAGMDWAAYFRAAGMERQNDFVVWQPSAVTGTSALVASQPLDVWKDYLTFHLLVHFAAVLPKGFGDDVPDRAQAGIAATNAALGEAVGRLYVGRYFPPQSKAAVSAMVENIRAAYRARIDKLSWMSPATKEKAQAKLAALTIGVGYPDSWIDYGPLSIVCGDAYGNQRRVEAFEYRRNIAKLSMPVDPSEWAMLPQTVGAVILFTPNTIDFGSGIFQSPYFDPNGDAASNYGSAGAGLAHEVSHSFDELGNLYDAHGNLGNWWTADDLARFRVAGAPLIARAETHCPQPGLCLHGKQVLSENIADITGLQIAHDAYLLSLHGKPDVVKNGLTGEQRFFLAYAQRWRKLYTDAALRQLVASDIHPPGEYRSDEVQNIDAWYKAFHVKPGDKLYLKPGERIHIW